jgi:uracil-DNA glycosylase family 4
MDLHRQLRQRLSSFAAAGVEWLPVGPRLTIAPRAIAPSPAIAEPAPVLTSPGDDRKVALAQLAAEVADCAKCPDLFATRTQTVFGVGPLSPEVCFVGEAPGADEDKQGEPFVGKAGQFLTRVITGCGFKREEVYICNTLKCRPPGNATPTTEQCENCRPYFERQIDLVKPKLIVCLGGTAAKNLLKTSTGIMKLRGKPYDYRGIPVYCTVHPSYIIRQTGEAFLKAKGECWEDMQLVLKHLDRPIPGKS